MAVGMKGNGRIVKLMEKVNILGKTAIGMKDNGKKG